MILFLIIFSTFLNLNFAQNDCGLIFMIEERQSLCEQSRNFTLFMKNIAINYFSDEANFALRGFGDNSSWAPLQWYKRRQFIDILDGWKYTNCISSNHIYYTPPLKNAYEFISNSTQNWNYALILAGSHDQVDDYSNASAIATKLASLDLYTAIWDFSQKTNNHPLFQTLVNNDDDRIKSYPTSTPEDLFRHFYWIISDLQASCPNSPNQLMSTPAPSTKYPISTTMQMFNSTTASSSSLPPSFPSSSPLNCVNMELIFILDRSQSMVPSVYNGSIKNFVKSFVQQFTFPNETTQDNLGYIRLGVIQFSDTPEVTLPLHNYSRNDFMNKVDQYVNINDDSGTSNVKDALISARNEFKLSSTTTNRAIILIVDDISTADMDNSIDAMNELKTLVNIPAGVIVPGYSGSVNEGLKHLKILLGNNSNLAYPSLDDASTNLPGAILNKYPCTVPPPCSLLVFLCETTEVIGATTKLQYLKMIQNLITNVQFNKYQRFSLGLFGNIVYKNIEAQTIDEFNDTLTAFIMTLESDNDPNGGKTYLTPILEQLYDTMNSTLYQKISVLLLGETEAIKDPTSAYQKAQLISSFNQDVYVIDESRFTFPSNLFPTLTNRLSGHVLNGTTTDNLDTFIPTLTNSLINKFNQYKC